MRIIRRIFGNIDSYEKKLVIERTLGVELENGYFNHDVYEDTETYRDIISIKSKFNLQDDILGTEFTNEEREESRTLIFNGSWASGYPQPESPKKILENTYANSCLECGVHDEQIAMFQVKEPKMGKHKMFQLNWIHDELFVDRKFYEDFFKNQGIEAKDVILYKNGDTLKSIVQLSIPIANFQLRINESDAFKCPLCNRIRFISTISGMYICPDGHDFKIVKSQEFFGSGHKAFNRILVSREFMFEMIKNKLAKIHQFIPMK